jgi:hypothetical protein
MTLERHHGTWTYDPEAGALYLYLNAPGVGPVVHTMTWATGPACWPTSTRTGT